MSTLKNTQMQFRQKHTHTKTLNKNINATLSSLLYELETCRHTKGLFFSNFVHRLAYPDIPTKVWSSSQSETKYHDFTLVLCLINAFFQDCQMVVLQHWLYPGQIIQHQQSYLWPCNDVRRTPQYKTPTWSHSLFLWNLLAQNSNHRQLWQTSRIQRISVTSGTPVLFYSSFMEAVDRSAFATVWRASVTASKHAQRIPF